MQTRDGDMKSNDPEQPPGLCRRIFNFIIERVLYCYAQGERRDEPARNMSNVDSKSEIEIHFKEIEEPVEQDDATKIEKTESFAKDIGTGKAKEKEIPLANGVANDGVSSIQGKAQNTKRGDRVSDDQKLRMSEEQLEPKLRHSRSFASMVSNINEKSEAFIQSRIEAMRNSNIDPQK